MTGLPASQRVSRRTVLRAAGGAAALAGLGAAAGCGSGESDALRVVVIGTAADKPIWQQAIDAFHRHHPDIRMEPVFLAGPSGGDQWTGFFSTVTTRIVGGEKYDLAYIPTEGQLLFASRHVMQPLDSYAKRDADAIADFEHDTDPRVLQQFARHRPEDGHTYYFPFADNTVAMMYHKPTFAKAKVAAPSPDWDWDTMRRVAHDVHRRTGAYTMAFATDMWNFGPWLFSNGAAILNDSWTRSVLGSSRALESIRFARSFVADGLAPPPGGAYDSLSAMGQGKLALTPASRPDTQGIRQRKLDPDDFGYLPFPRNTHVGTSVGYGSIGMFKVSTKKEQAWEFIKFTLSKEFQRVQARSVFQGAAPVRRSVATGPDMRYQSPSGTEYLYEGLTHSTVVPGVTNQARLADPFSKALKQILTGGLDPEHGLDTLQQQFAANLHD